MTKFIGWMYDIAREQSPKPHVLRDMLTQSLAAGYNAVGFYLEHRFAYPSAPWAADRGVLTPNLVKELQEEFAPKGLRVIPFINTLGHMEGFVRAEEGRQYAEGSRFGSEQICPSRTECVQFAKNLIDDIITTFDDDWVHLGGDEPWQLGDCPLCQKRVDDVGKAGLYGEFYRDLCGHVLDQGRRPALWADMLNEHPAALEYLPKETILFDWQYDNPPLETSQKLRDAGFDVICAPALHTYDAAWLHLNLSIENIEAHKRDAESVEALGVLLTTWEMGYFTQYAPVMPIVYAAGKYLADDTPIMDALREFADDDYAKAADILGNKIPATCDFLKPGAWRNLRDRLIMRQNPFELWRDWRVDACGKVGDEILSLCDAAARVIPVGHPLRWPIALYRVSVEFVNRVEFAARSYAGANREECISHLENARRMLVGLGPICDAAEEVGGSVVDRQRLNSLLTKVDRAIARVFRVMTNIEDDVDEAGTGPRYRPAFETILSDAWLPRDQAAWRTGARV